MMTHDKVLAAAAHAEVIHESSATVPKRIGLIGASGGLGSGVARHLAARGIRARMIVRRSGATIPARDLVQADLDRPRARHSQVTEANPPSRSAPV